MVNRETWWPQSSNDIYIAALVPPVGEAKPENAKRYVVVKKTEFMGFDVVISEYGSGGTYTSLAPAQAYHDAIAQVIGSKAYKAYKAHSQQVFKEHGIG